MRSQAVKRVLRKLLGPVLRLAVICDGRARVKPAGAQQRYPDKLPNMSFQREAEPSSEGACERDTGERGGGESTATGGSVGVATNLISYRFESEKYLRWEN